MPGNYPPPYQDIVTLSEHLCLSMRTIEAWVEQRKLPPPINAGGKRLWRWKDVERAMAQLSARDAHTADLERIRTFGKK